MNSTVKATGMKIKAKAEAGLLINEVKDADDDNWDDEAVANSLPNTSLVPTSTTDATAWFHANSKTASDEAGATAKDTASTNLSGDYEELSSLKASKTDAATGVNAEVNTYYKDLDNSDSYAVGKDTAYYVMYKYYLKVSNENGLTLARTANAQNVAIKEVKVTLPSTVNSGDLDKALRVGIKIGGKMYIYAPVYGANTTSSKYYAVTSIDNTGSTQAITTADVVPFATNTMTYTALTSIPGISGKTVTSGSTTTHEGEEVDIYIWFEGEDDNCQSDKITETLDDITVDVLFSLETIGATAPDTIANNEF